MNADRSRMGIVVVFVLTLLAGVVAGVLVTKLPMDRKAVETNQPAATSLVQQLGLTPQQNDQMRQIWQAVQEKTQQSMNDATKARDQRDLAIQQLVPTDKLEAYRAANQSYDAAVAKLKAQRDQLFDQAVRQTREILSPAQQEKYNGILKNRLEGAGGASHDAADKARGTDAAAQPSPS